MAAKIVTRDGLIRAFTEWHRRADADPELFSADAWRGHATVEWGTAAADYLLQVLRDVAAVATVADDQVVTADRPVPAGLLPPPPDTPEAEAGRSAT
jgi:hypothetical protein